MSKIKTGVFSYSSVCCKELGTKPPCVKPRDKKEAANNSLGSWRCTKCKKPCKVTRHGNTLAGTQ